MRGIHPVILEDRGLDAALSAVVARSPIPVELDVDVAVRPPAAIESAAYFVVNEALANVARHAHATRAQVSIARAGESPRHRGRATTVRAEPIRIAVPDCKACVIGWPGWAGPSSHQPARRAHHHLCGAAMRIVIAEDSVLLRAGLTRILVEAGEEVVATVGAADELDGCGRTAPTRSRASSTCGCRRPIPTMVSGPRSRSGLVGPRSAILVLSQYVEERYATDLLADSTAAIGYLLKDRVADVEEFLGAVRRVGAGGTALDPEVVAQLLARARRRDPVGAADTERTRSPRPHGRGSEQSGDRDERSS